MKKTLELIKENIRKKLDRDRISRDIVGVILDYETIVLEEGIIARNKRKYGISPIKNALNNLVNEGLLDTGYESGTRWYCIRRECQNHFTSEIIPNQEFRNQLKRFISIYE